MSAHIIYDFGFIAAGESGDLFLHGFLPNQYVGLDVHAQPGSGDNTPDLGVNISRVHVASDGTLAHSIVITNNRPRGAPGQFNTNARAQLVGFFEAIT
jgi:hypothetical protein